MLPVVAIMQHDPKDEAAYMTAYLQTKGINYAIFVLFDESFCDLLPSSTETPIYCVPHPTVAHEWIPVRQGSTEAQQCCSICAVASLGGSISINDDLAYLITAKELVRSCIATKTPYMGHCLGGQLLSAALGGCVLPAPHKEVGWISVTVEGEGEEGMKKWFDGPTADVFMIHGEVFTIPEGCRRVATSAYCPNQAFQYVGQYVFGTQFHPEVDPKKVMALMETVPYAYTTAELVAMTPEERKKNISADSMSKEEVVKEIAAGRVETNYAIAQRMYDTWCDGFRRAKTSASGDEASGTISTLG